MRVSSSTAAEWSLSVSNAHVTGGTHHRGDGIALAARLKERARTLAVPRDGCSQDGETHKTLLGAVGLEKSFVLEEVPRGARASWMKLADHVKDAKHASWDHGRAKSLSHRRRGSVEPVTRHLSDTRGLVGSAVQRPSWQDSAPERSGNTGIPVALSSGKSSAWSMRL